MTESLKTMLDREASSVAFVPTDLDTITRAGQRRVRHRRRTAALAGIAALAMFGGAAVLGDGGEGRDSVVAGGAGSAETVSWAIGSTIHVGDDTIEVGHPIRAYVRTSLGFVVLDDADNVWSVTNDGVTEIGRTTPPRPNDLDEQQLASDPSGSLVGWVGPNPSGDPTTQTYDQATGESRSFPLPGTQPPDGGVFFAIDDRTGYWRTTTGVVAVDIDTGEERQVVRISGEVHAVENGVIAFSTTSDEVILAGRSVEGARELVDFKDRPSEGMTDPVRLSPTGAWLSLGIAEAVGDSEDSITINKITPVVYDVVTGERITLDQPAGTLAIPSVWLNDDTLQVLVFHGEIGPSPVMEDAALYTCTVPSGSCEAAAELGDVVLPSLVLPEGRYYPDPAED